MAAVGESGEWNPEGLTDRMRGKTEKSERNTLAFQFFVLFLLEIDFNMKKVFLFLALVLAIVIPAKAQLYVGGGFSYYKSRVNNTEIQVKHFNISPELGYRYQRLSFGLTFSYASDIYSEYYKDSKQYTFEPYTRFDLVSLDNFGFYLEAFYSLTHHSEVLQYSNTGPVHFSHLVGLSPGVYYKFNDRLMAVFMFGFAGYSSSHEANGFKGFGVDLSMNTSRIGFYYSFW